MTISRWRLGAIVGGLLFLAVAVYGLGLVPITASSGHWAITEWFLHTAMRRSVGLHSTGITPPPGLETDPALAVRGAGHYDSGCAPCHGDPVVPKPRVPSGMTPEAPYLAVQVPQWEPSELFYIVKHGVKFTGMPAWPALERDDEVWAIVAFLLELPDLDEAEYLRMVHGGTLAVTDGAAAPELVVESCGRCHGVDGRGRGWGAYPRLAGQKADYLVGALEAYRDGRRHSGIMEPVAMGLSAEAIREVAGYYSALPPGPPSFAVESAAPGPGAAASEAGEAEGEVPATLPPSGQLPPVRFPGYDTGDLPGLARAVARGEQIARDGLPERKIPACSDCHGPAPREKNPHYPYLAGQYPGYLMIQLELFEHGYRGGSEYAELMEPVEGKLDPSERKDLALYYASLVPEGAAVGLGDAREDGIAPDAGTDPSSPVPIDELGGPERPGSGEPTPE